MAAYDDKIVWSALGKILMAVYEPKFSDSMYGFRPNWSQHNALKEVTQLIEKSKKNYIIDADIKGYSNNLEHGRIIELVRFRLADSVSTAESKP